MRRERDRRGPPDNEHVIHNLVLHNEKLIPSGSAALRPGQVGLFTGWGVFTTLRIYRGVPFAIERHWARLTRDAALLHVELPKELEPVRNLLLKLVAANRCPEAKMRVNFIRNTGGLFEGPGPGRPTDLLAFTADLTSGPPSVKLGLQDEGRHARSQFAGTKTASWAHNLTLFETARRQGMADTLLLNERDEVAECTSANIFAVQDGATLTPPLSCGPLPGVTREVMLEELNEGVEERVLSVDDLYAADEVFITSSTRELVPVSQIGGRHLRRSDWPVMRRLRVRLQEYVRHYCREALDGS